MRVLLALFFLLYGAGPVLAQPDQDRFQRLTASDADSPDQLGISVAVDGDLAVAGAFYDDCDTGPFCGSAYVYERQADGDWAEVQKLRAPDPGGQLFGNAVAILGDRIAVGAYQEDCDAGANCGAAYLFDRQPDGTWALTQTFTASDAAAGDLFGTALHLADGALYVSAVGDDCGTADLCGAVYVFDEQDDGSWAEAQKIHPPDPGIQLGVSISLSDGLLAIGASRASDASGVQTGAVFLYEPSSDGTWTSTQTLTPSDGGEQAFGFSTLFIDDELVVGAPLADCRGGADCGAAYVFVQQPDGTWGETQKLTFAAIASYRFGTSLASAAGYLFVGAPGFDRVDAPDIGGVAAHGRNDAGEWVARRMSSPLLSGTRYGTALAGSGPDLFIGWPGYTCDAGPDCGLVRVNRYVPASNAAPVADAGPDQTVIEGQTVSLDGSGSSDSNGDALSYAWTLTGPGTPSLTDADTATPTFCAAEAGDYTASLTVTDPSEANDTDEALVTVLSADEALDALDADVADLGPVEDGGDGTLNGGQANALSVKLRQAQRKEGEGEDPSPHLDAFRNQVMNFEADGILSPEQAAALLADLDAIDEATEAPCTSDAAAAPAASATASTPQEFALAAYPNPLRTSATIAFEVDAATSVRLVVFDALGRTVAVLADGPVEDGRHETSFDAAALPSGIYLVRMTTDAGFSQTRRLTVLR